MRKFLTHEDPVVPMQHPNVLIETAKSQGARLDDMLEGSGIRKEMLSQPDARISYLQFGVLVINALRLTGNPSLGLDFGKRIHVSNMGIVGLAVLSSQTAEQALEAGLRFGPILAPGWDLALHKRGPIAVFSARPALSFGMQHAFATEALLAAVSELARFVLGSDTHVHSVHLDYPQPQYVARYAELASAELRFDQEGIEVLFDATALEQPLRSFDPITREFALRYCEAQLAELPNREGLLRCVRAILELRPGQYADLPSVARALHSTPRTLRRDLERLGSSYQQILDDVRKQHTLACLRTSQLTFDAASAQLGFSDVRALRRAVRRWTGLSPLEFRSRATARPDSTPKPLTPTR